VIVGARLLGIIYSAVASMAAPASADLVQSDDQTVTYYGLTFPAVIGDARQIFCAR
jgi:hypothetical protein